MKSVVGVVLNGAEQHAVIQPTQHVAPMSTGVDKRLSSITLGGQTESPLKKRRIDLTSSQVNLMMD